MRMLNWLFIGLILLDVIGIVLSLLQMASLKPSDGATLFAALLAVGFVWWQGHLIKRQMELQAALELDSEWNSEEMLENRSAAWNDQNEANEGTVESVLEFLEKVSTFEKRGVISLDLIWDTFGWYIWRYYHYSSAVIQVLRSKWTPNRPDPTLYQDLEALFPKLLHREIEIRNRLRSKGQRALTARDVIEELDMTREKFVAAEKGDTTFEVPPKVIIELRPSHIDQGEVGVFAVSDIPKGQKVADGIAETDFQSLIPWTAFESYNADVKKKVHDFCIGTPEGFVPPENLDFNKLSIEWYLNHSCEGNCGFNDDGDFVAIRDIEQDSELAYDYGLAESNPNFKMNCKCGSAKCRKVITGNDWKDEAFSAQNRQNMLPRLRRVR